MPTFLTVKEAAKLKGKSPSSIRRIIYPILADDNHPDRHQIQPSPEKARELRIQGDNFAWKISEKFLNRVVPEASPKTESEDVVQESPPVIELLRRELEIKNKQIETQNELLKGLSERLREGNILIGSLQQQLAITDGSARNKAVVDADTSERASQQGSDPTAPPQRKRAQESLKKTPWYLWKIF